MAGQGAHRARGRAGRGALILLLVLVVLATGAFGVYRYATGASGPSRTVSVEIPPGATAGDVGELLERRGVIRSSLAFRLSAQLRGYGSAIQAGSYELVTNMTIPEVFDVLEAGPVLDTVTLTVPEGLEVGEVADEAGTLGLNPADFQRAATSGRYSVPPYLPDGAESVEGFLFPKTYEFSTDGLDEEVVIDRLLAQFDEEAGTLDWSRADNLGMSPYEVVIVASLVEREARIPEDRPKIAAVIYNRLREGMPLQIDATVQYALPEGNRELTFEDYRVESPYNTYLHPGLPPTPIASPGLDSLRAALEPADADYLYFVVVDADTGRHAFADTYQEFLRLKEQAGL
jgi:peptidoglycan lytic transglycosylase G